MHDRRVDGLAVTEWGDPAAPGVLLWPGLGSTGAYFVSVAEGLPGRAVAVDPPGFGDSPALASYSYERLVEMARAVCDECGCRAVVGHSLGAFVAAGIAGEPPPGLRAAVLIDGGFLDAAGMAQLGMPTMGGRQELTEWLEANTPRFPDWETATRELAAMIGAEVTPAVEDYVRDVFGEVNGEICGRARSDVSADLLLATLRQDVVARARRIRVPTLLIACGQPAERRAMREEAWQRFAQASPSIELHVADAWGHNPILQDREAATSLIAGWLGPHL